MYSQLLKQYPYCLDANRILVEILPATQRAESAQVYRQRVIELEPYSAFVQDFVFHSDQVADAAVNLEQLEYEGQAVEMGANWDGSLGIGLASRCRRSFTFIIATGLAQATGGACLRLR